MSSDRDVKSGLGGWLLLMAVGQVITPLSQVFEFLTVTFPALKHSSPGLLGVVVWFEVVTSLVMTCACIYMAFLFFTKKLLFPKFYVGFIILMLILIILDAWLSTLVMPEVPMFNDVTIGRLVSFLPACLIWIPYVMMSKRVKVTFVN
jgi:hypothetical protein